MQWLLGTTQQLSNFAERGLIGIVAIHIAQELGQFFERVPIDPAVMFQTVLSARPQLVERPSRFSDAEYRYVKAFIADQLLNRGKDLLVGEVTGSSEEHQRVCLE